jgi:hypothetical protein
MSDCAFCAFTRAEKECWIEAVANAMIEKERIVEFLRSSAEALATSQREYPGSWSTAEVENQAAVGILDLMAKSIENGTWVDALANQQEVRRRAALKLVKVVDLATYERRKP